MKDWVFLSKDGKDEYIKYLADSVNGKITSTDDFVFEDSNRPIVLRGILKHKIMKRCWEENRSFYYIDTGYFGNEINSSNPNGWKFWHRIVKNNLQHDEIITQPKDRWLSFNKQMLPWKKTGRKILIAKPDIKPCKFYGIDLEEWVQQTIDTIKKYTDRPIVIRERAPKREDRVTTSTLKEALNDDVFALVTYNSVAATESVLYGIPAFTLAPCNAAKPVSSQDLSQIENPYYPESDKLLAWAAHLAYGQFHVSEFKNGWVMKKLNEMEQLK
jgi:hypothetical protein